MGRTKVTALVRLSLCHPVTAFASSVQHGEETKQQPGCSSKRGYPQDARSYALRRQAHKKGTYEVSAPTDLL